MSVRNTFLLIIVTSLTIASAFNLNGRRGKQPNRTVAAGLAQQHFAETRLSVNRSLGSNPRTDGDFVIFENTSERIESFDENSDSDIDLDGKLCNVQQRNCMCVPWYQCKDENIIIKDGEGLIEERKKNNKNLCRELQVCCKTKNEETDTDELRERASDHESKETRCGQRNSCGIDRRLVKPQLVGEADFGEWPWQTIVLTYIDEDEGKYLFHCGGAFIGEKWILTVAHCLNKLTKEEISNLHVRLGEWDVEDDENNKEFLKHINLKVKRVHKHAKFNSRNLHNDIALLELNDEVEYKPHISSVCVPSEDILSDPKLWRANCVATGWGKLPDKLSTHSRILKELSLPLIESDKCQNLLRETRLGHHFILNPGFICAGGQENVDAC
ncbi:Serine proteinase stubble-like protein, partial [Leptotrombidium deliense]